MPCTYSLHIALASCMISSYALHAADVIKGTIHNTTSRNLQLTFTQGECFQLRVLIGSNQTNTSAELLPSFQKVTIAEIAHKDGQPLFISRGCCSFKAPTDESSEAPTYELSTQENGEITLKLNGRPLPDSVSPERTSALSLLLSDNPDTA